MGKEGEKEERRKGRMKRDMKTRMEYMWFCNVDMKIIL